MVILRTARFEEEASRFSLRYTCEDCGNFDAARERCRHEWPTEKHRRAASGEARPEVVFCKEFETR